MENPIFTDGSFVIFNNNGLKIYKKKEDFKAEYEYDDNDNLIWYRDSNKFWSIKKYDKNNKLIYHADSDGLLFVDI